MVPNLVEGGGGGRERGARSVEALKKSEKKKHWKYSHRSREARTPKRPRQKLGRNMTATLFCGINNKNG